MLYHVGAAEAVAAVDFHTGRLAYDAIGQRCGIDGSSVYVGGRSIPADADRALLVAAFGDVGLHVGGRHGSRRVVGGFGRRHATFTAILLCAYRHAVCAVVRKFHLGGHGLSSFSLGRCGGLAVHIDVIEERSVERSTVGCGGWHGEAHVRRHGIAQDGYRKARYGRWGAYHVCGVGKGGQTRHLVVVVRTVVTAVADEGTAGSGRIHLEGAPVAPVVVDSVPEDMPCRLVEACRLVEGYDFSRCGLSADGSLAGGPVDGIHLAAAAESIEGTIGRRGDGGDAFGHRGDGVGLEGSLLRVVEGDVSELVDAGVVFVPEYAVECALRVVVGQVAGNVVPPHSVVGLRQEPVVLGRVQVEGNGEYQRAVAVLGEVLGIVDAVAVGSASVDSDVLRHAREVADIVGRIGIDAGTYIVRLAIAVDDAAVKGGRTGDRFAQWGLGGRAGQGGTHAAARLYIMSQHHICRRLRYHLFSRRLGRGVGSGAESRRSHGQCQV